MFGSCDCTAVLATNSIMPTIAANMIDNDKRKGVNMLRNEITKAIGITFPGRIPHIEYRLLESA